MKLIGLTGHTGAGKHTVARFLCETEGFVEATFADQTAIERLRKAPDYLHISGIVISDICMEYEAAWIRRQGGDVWHIRKDVHQSNIIDVADGDLIIDSNSTIEALHEFIHTIITNEEEAS